MQLSPASDHFTTITHLENVCIPLNIFSKLYGCNNVYAARSEMIIGDTHNDRTLFILNMYHANTSVIPEVTLCVQTQHNQISY